jgi:hypothetical protein
MRTLDCDAHEGIRCAPPAQPEGQRDQRRGDERERARTGCGAGGTITIANTLIVTPDSIFGVQWTAYMIFMVLLGGLGTFERPVLGALVLFGIQQEFQNDGSRYLVGLGAVAIGVTLILPREVWGAVRAPTLRSRQAARSRHEHLSESREWRL